MRLSSGKGVLAATVVALVAASAAPADIVEYYVSGYVRAVSGTPYENAAEYDEFIVEFAVDNDSSLDTAVQSAEITFFLGAGGEHSASWNDPTSIMVENDTGMPPDEVWDQVYFSWWSGYEPKLEVNATDMAAEWLSSSDLPVPWETLPDYLSPYGDAYGEVFYRVNDNQDRAEGQVTDAGIVPEPGSLSLLVLVALGMLRRGR